MESKIKITFGHFILDPTTLTLWVRDDNEGNNRKNRLSLAETELLKYMLNAPQLVHSRESLLAAAWHGKIVGPNSLNMAIGRLRSVLKISPPEVEIKNIPQKGYALITHVKIIISDEFSIENTISDIPPETSNSFISPLLLSRKNISLLSRRTFTALIGILFVLSLSFWFNFLISYITVTCSNSPVNRCYVNDERTLSEISSKQTAQKKEDEWQFLSGGKAIVWSSAQEEKK